MMSWKKLVERSLITVGFCVYSSQIAVDQDLEGIVPKYGIYMLLSEMTKPFIQSDEGPVSRGSGNDRGKKGSKEASPTASYTVTVSEETEEDFEVGLPYFIVLDVVL